jgi:hypothetical protein
MGGGDYGLTSRDTTAAAVGKGRRSVAGKWFWGRRRRRRRKRRRRRRGERSEEADASSECGSGACCGVVTAGQEEVGSGS